MWDRFSHPSTSIGSSNTFIESHDSRTLVVENGLVGMQADQQLGALLAALQESTSMS
jgi:hypothetical protein